MARRVCSRPMFLMGSWGCCWDGVGGDEFSAARWLCASIPSYILTCIFPSLARSPGVFFLDRLNIYSVYSGLFDPCFLMRVGGSWSMPYARVR